MKERPILFSTENVKAILDDRKTQTRRVIKPQPPVSVNILPNALKGEWWWYEHQGRRPQIKCPYGQVGDRLWVRETIYCDWGGEWRYKAGDAPVKGGDFDKGEYFDGDDMSPRPSIFMPRWASRITLEITDTRVERLQEITEEDVLEEGSIKGLPVATGYANNFKWLWNSLNAKRGYGWDFNPWVWVISFRRIDEV